MYWIIFVDTAKVTNQRMPTQHQAHVSMPESQKTLFYKWLLRWAPPIPAIKILSPAVDEKSKKNPAVLH